MVGAGLEGPYKQLIDARREVAMGNVDAQLGKTRFLAGDELTAADINALFYFTTGRLFFPSDLSAWPNVVRWIGEVGARPAYLKALEKGDPGLEPLVHAEPPEKSLL